MSADATPQPVRRVVVSISGDLPESRSVITDDTGRFTFTRLPVGRFTIGARKLAYLPTQFGVTKPGRAGSPIALAAGEKRQITLTIFRGAVIAGTLRDTTGAPLSGMTVAAVDLRLAANSNIQPTPELVTTDDRGVYRFFGLPPSEYVIAASPAPPGSGEIGSRSGAELDALFATLTDRQNRPPAPGTPAQPPLPSSASVGYAPVYYPGTAMFAEASRLRIAAGEEKTGVNFAVSQVPVASIEGTVTGNVPNLASVILAIIPDAPRLSNFVGTFGITSQPPTTLGEFKYGNLSPGRYRIVARVRQSVPDPNAPPSPTGGRGGAGAGAPPPGVNIEEFGDMLWGYADVDVRGTDVKGVGIALQLGGTLSGKLVFDAEKAPVPDDLTQFRVAVYQVRGTGLAQQGSTRVGNAITTIPAVTVRPDGSFVIRAIGPTEYYVTCLVPASLASIWKMRSVVADGRELLDTNLEGPVVDLANVRVLLSDKRTELSGTLQGGSGQPLSEFHVIAFSADRTNWRMNSRRNMSARPATNGRFIFTDLPAGEYLLAALTDLDPLEWQNTGFLEQVAPSAVRISLGEGEKKVQDLRIR